MHTTARSLFGAIAIAGALAAASPADAKTPVPTIVGTPTVQTANDGTYVIFHTAKPIADSHLVTVDLNGSSQARVMKVGAPVRNCYKRLISYKGIAVGETYKLRFFTREHRGGPAKGDPFATFTVKSKAFTGEGPAVSRVKAACQSGS